MLVGSMINSIGVFLGVIIGVLFKKKLSENIQDTVLKSLGLVTIYIAVSSFNENVNVINIIISMSVGSFIGESLNLEDKFSKFGKWVQSKINNGNSGFAKGLLEASLLFCMGSYGIVGALESGVEGTHVILTSKAILDGITAIFITAKRGVSVAFAGLIMFVYQGGLTLLASVLKPVLSSVALANIGVLGGIILISVAFNILEIGKFKSMNYVPSLVLTVALNAIFGI